MGTQSPRIQISYVDPRSLKPNPWNTNVVSPDNEARIESSLERFGDFKPVIVRELPSGELQILGGEHRTLASVRMKKAEIPIINLGRISDQKAKEISLVDNGRYGVDDSLGLAKLLEELGTADDLKAFLPYSDAELDAIFASTEVDLDNLDLDDAEAHEAATPATKPIATHQTMKFRVRVEDAAEISQRIQEVMADQGFTKDVAEVNAGDALAFLFKKDFQ